MSKEKEWNKLLKKRYIKMYQICITFSKISQQQESPNPCMLSKRAYSPINAHSNWHRDKAWGARRWESGFPACLQLWPAGMESVIELRPDDLGPHLLVIFLLGRYMMMGLKWCIWAHIIARSNPPSSSSLSIIINDNKLKNFWPLNQ